MWKRLILYYWKLEKSDIKNDEIWDEIKKFCVEKEQCEKKEEWKLWIKMYKNWRRKI